MKLLFILLSVCENVNDDDNRVVVSAGGPTTIQASILCEDPRCDNRWTWLQRSSMLEPFLKEDPIPTVIFLVHVELILLRGRQGAPTIFPYEFSKWFFNHPQKKPLKRATWWKGVQQPQGWSSKWLKWWKNQKSIRLRMLTKIVMKGPFFWPKEPRAQKYPRIIIIYILIHFTCFYNTNWLTPSTVALHCEAGRAMSTVGSAF